MKKNILILASLFVLFSCKKDEETQDTEKPTFSKILINQIDANTSNEIDIFLNKDSRDTLTFDFSMMDNVELSQLQVEIHEAFDNHAHSRFMADTIIHQDTLAFGPKIYDLTGNMLTSQIGITLPKTIVYGTYHLECVLLDKTGNRTEKIVEFQLKESNN